jgi:NAD-dependent oxidoreductase involved in siderophore biosynthesis
VDSQRKLYKKKRLKQDRIDKLNEIGFVWSFGKDLKDWEERYQQLCEYKSVHGNSNVPQTYPENPALGRWINKQRHFYKTKQLKQNYIDKLNEIGFVWVLRERKDWEERYQELQEYKRDHGNYNVPQIYPEHRSLGMWVQNQRQLYKRKQIKQERIIKLNEIGFIWKAK